MIARTSATRSQGADGDTSRIICGCGFAVFAQDMNCLIFSSGTPSFDINLDLVAPV